ARVNHVATGDADRIQVLDLAAERRRGGLVEELHAFGHFAFADAGETSERERENFDVAASGHARDLESFGGGRARTTRIIVGHEGEMSTDQDQKAHLRRGPG